eukprot:CAMPEP_0173060902 /NCGR_PEP_ID=MMETSP1102-20130122/2892_1 /TAXON_ID=49646 /ORGANISM="Geminigera sp., Strain Caron Lab Isolate" /LENGTH=140 /DNA_ID=CAMNT_0013927257 /DNA_START=423 /DNA_END=845 /DNA_ORIENTATION=-
MTASPPRIHSPPTRNRRRVSVAASSHDNSNIIERPLHLHGLQPTLLSAVTQLPLLPQPPRKHLAICCQRRSVMKSARHHPNAHILQDAEHHRWHKRTCLLPQSQLPIITIAPHEHPSIFGHGSTMIAPAACHVNDVVCAC